MLLGGEIGAGEAYMDGLWSSPDLPALLRVAALNREALALSEGWWRWPAQAAADAGPPGAAEHRGRQPPEHRGALRPRQRLLPAVPRRDDDLFERRLRGARTSRSPTPSATSTRSSPSGPGCAAASTCSRSARGWGGFALYAAGELGCRVTTITISPAQHALATERVREAGPRRPRVASSCATTATIEGTYDAIVSIEMLEAVGAEYYDDVLRGLRPRAPAGRPAEPADDRLPGRRPTSAQRRGANWIQTYIFPGGVLPSLAAIERSLHGTRLLVRRVEDIAPSYVADAPRPGGRAFLAQLDEVRAMGFDERFIRMWDYYLAISEAGFATGLTQDLQIVFEKRRGLA